MQLHNFVILIGCRRICSSCSESCSCYRMGAVWVCVSIVLVVVEIFVLHSTEITSQAVYVWHNTEVCLCYHCCHGKALSVKCNECVSSFLHLCNALVYCHLCPCWFYHSFPHHPINGTILGEKYYWACNVCCDFLYNLCLQHFSFQG